jgi:CRP-like cAMP-binding protein
MTVQAVPPFEEALPLQRLFSLAPLTEDEKGVLRSAVTITRKVPAGRDIVVEGTPVVSSAIIVSGWAYRARQFADGRVQILGLLLPGELIGRCRHFRPLAATTVISATPLVLCTTPDAPEGSGLARAYSHSAALEEFYLFRQIARLGRLIANERTIDWLLETRERLALVGLVNGDQFPMPLTQSLISDLLGITDVHLSRTIGTLRTEGWLEMGRGVATLRGIEQLMERVDFRPALVSETE